MDMSIQLLVSSLVIGGVYALIAPGVSMIYASTQVINFAQGEMAMLGGLLGVTFFSQLGLPYPVAFLLTLVSVGVVGLLFAKFAIEPLVHRKAPLPSLVILTLAVAFLLQRTAELVWGKNDLY